MAWRLVAHLSHASAIAPPILRLVVRARDLPDRVAQAPIYDAILHPESPHLSSARSVQVVGRPPGSTKFGAEYLGELAGPVERAPRLAR